MEDEICICVKTNPIVLQYNFSSNPLVCLNCNLEKNGIKLNSEVIAKTELWNYEYEKYYSIWLNSKESVPEINNPFSNLNSIGFSLLKLLNETTLCYYWWHLNEDEKIWNCPKCELLLQVESKYKVGLTKTCNNCMIVVRD